MTWRLVHDERKEVEVWLRNVQKGIVHKNCSLCQWTSPVAVADIVLTVPWKYTTNIHSRSNSDDKLEKRLLQGREFLRVERNVIQAVTAPWHKTMQWKGHFVATKTAFLRLCERRRVGFTVRRTCPAGLTCQDSIRGLILDYKWSVIQKQKLK